MGLPARGNTRLVGPRARRGPRRKGRATAIRSGSRALGCPHYPQLFHTSSQLGTRGEEDAFRFPVCVGGARYLERARVPDA